MYYIYCFLASALLCFKLLPLKVFFALSSARGNRPDWNQFDPKGDFAAVLFSGKSVALIP